MTVQNYKKVILVKRDDVNISFCLALIKILNGTKEKSFVQIVTDFCVVYETIIEKNKFQVEKKDKTKI